MSIITGFQGQQFVRSGPGWDQHKNQYATSSFGVEHDMDPALIAYPESIADVEAAVTYARSQNVAVAVRTGGHQYSGASSTNGPNIQLDLSNTFLEFEQREWDGKTLVFAGISWRLAEFNKKLGSLGLFVPHGQCGYVRLGGHVQTGGYGQLGRSFGLLGDHVWSLYIVDQNGHPKEINKKTDPELFYALLGGSPGNLGILTHVLLEVHRASDYPGTQGLRALYLYGNETLTKLLNILVKMSDDDDFPRNYDLCISVLSSDFWLPWLSEGLDDRLDEIPDDELREKLPEGRKDLFSDDDGNRKWPRVIVVYAQYVPFPGEHNPPAAEVAEWFEAINSAGIHVPLTNKEVMHKPLSYLTSQWIFPGRREFQLPYIKRTYATASRSLEKSGWVDWAVERVDEVVAPVFNEQWLSAQFQCFGGKYSRLTSNAGNGTAFSWRDSSLVATMDNFHAPSAKDDAADWQKQNDAGSLEKFSAQDRRLLWGCWGNYNLDAVWPCYYENEEKYNNLRQARGKADPNGILFTPNTFCVKHPLS